ncbi:hypothetical protein L226DRAFT_466652 [Lentinus tigrinus ALCF2SS1-7]|uniref:Uncharacterized protein n=1 Tax=Lentinus tigrinus ALCF2SS1-6 TaxID=1328759 RepID=A0A5C2RRD9_9APHY|nr:hypothetical protein L227DRAFT_513261 [Lentinus tigrinus ALCF2SS1-6]RPD72658.1 hypothetical protein L226DRAFT_466652 [Lentinus tigrinus ALCF2SS1-7]
MKSVFSACGGSALSVQDVLVVRPEYVWLLETLQEGYLAKVPSIVVTGQPGIGKTVFLLYLLLYRLERKLPTAIHLYADIVVMFDHEGASISSASDSETSIMKEYWALSDSNEDVLKPCPPFMTSNARVIQASSPKPDRWKAWCKHRSGQVVVSDLPRPLEIGATVKELGLQTDDVYPLISQWGPCTRSILAVLCAQPKENRESVEADLRRAALAAADAILASPTAFLLPLEAKLPDSVGSDVLFVLPYRPQNPKTGWVTDSGGAFTTIPTSYLTEAFNNARRLLDKKQALQFFRWLSPHALTRSLDAWNLEKRMHAHLSSSSPPLTIFRKHNAQSTMQPSLELLYGTVSALSWCGRFPTFYWLPSVSDFPGIDGVLGDSANVYVLQATVAGEYRSPEEGLRRVWAHFDRKIRDKRAWHIVFVTDRKELALQHVETFTETLEGFTLGRARIGVMVWGCILATSR